MNPVLFLLLPALFAAGPRFKLFSAKNDGFQVDLPGTPDVEVEWLEAGVVRRSYAVPTDDGGSLVVRVTTLPPSQEPLEKVLDLDRAIAAEGGEVKESKAIALGGLEGREVLLDGAPLDKRVRAYRGKRQLYVTCASWPHGAKPHPEVRRHFSDTFRIFGVPPEDQARPADGVFAVIERLEVKDHVGKKDAHEVSVSWVADVRVEPGDSAVTLEALCRCGGKVHKASYPVKVGPGKKGQKVHMSHTLSRMRGELAHCELTFGWGAAGKPHAELYRACWPGPEADLYAGACE